MAQAPAKRTRPIDREELLKSVMWEINKNYREANLSRVAQEYDVSLAYVSECVRRQTGKSFKDLLHKRRMEQSARLLRRTDLSIKQIIAAVGYENTSYFYHLFCRYYGQTPQQYRRTHSRV